MWKPHCTGSCKSEVVALAMSLTLSFLNPALLTTLGLFSLIKSGGCAGSGVLSPSGVLVLIPRDASARMEAGAA